MNQITDIIRILLPKQFSTSSINYSEKLNMLTTSSFRSPAGNTYFQGIRVSDKIIVIYDIGINHLHPYLNKVTIYAYRDRQVKQIVTRFYSCRIYKQVNKSALVKELLMKELRKEVNNVKLNISEQLLDRFTETLMKDIYKNQIETLKSIQAQMMQLN